MNKDKLEINESGYFEMPGLNVLVFNNAFSDGHQGGVEIIQNGTRVATCGDLRLSPSYGQWQPLPKLGRSVMQGNAYPEMVNLEDKVMDREKNEISMACSYPNEERHLKGFNPIIYPDLELNYHVKVQAEGKAFTITVDMEKPVPDGWAGRIGFSIELFPGDLYGKTYFMDDVPGIIPRQAMGPTWKNEDGEVEAVPLAAGRKLVIAPEDKKFMLQVESLQNDLEFIDGSLKHNNGWFIIRSTVPAGAAGNAVKWRVTPNVIPGWKQEPVIHVSQVGYHPSQKKTAYIELDKTENSLQEVAVEKLLSTGRYETVCQGTPETWGRYYRYKYLTFDFTGITESGMYRIQYGGQPSNLFKIGSDVYRRGVWQPTLEYFLPTQMCHMRVSQKYRLWHGLCHMDDALMAPPGIQHFDGYSHKSYTGSFPYKPLQHIPGLNAGGWHDAGDFDIRTDTQVETSLAMAYIYDEFHIDYDETTVDQHNNLVEIHQPDGKPDVLQQLEHGMLWLTGFYKNLGVMGMGIICPTLRQYVHLGDPAGDTDNKVFTDPDGRAASITSDRLWYKKIANRYSSVFDPGMCMDEIEAVIPELDDRLVFLEENVCRQLYAAAGFAAAARVLKGHNDSLAQDCLRIAEEQWQEYGQYSCKNADLNKIHTITDLITTTDDHVDSNKIHALTELILTTGEHKYIRKLLELQPVVVREFAGAGWAVSRVMHLVDDRGFAEAVEEAAREYQRALEEEVRKTPFGCFMLHNERIGMQNYYLNKRWPEIFSPDILFDIINYLHGCHGGDTTNTLVSGVGGNSPTVAYGFNRADWSYVPGGTFWNAINLVLPDFLEDKVWPYLWQEREYITNLPAMYMFDVIAADRILNRER